MTRADEDRRQQDRIDLAAIRATTQELCDLIAPFREEQRRLADTLAQLHDELCEDEE